MIESFEQVRGSTKCPFARKACIIEVSSGRESLEEICQSLQVVLPQLKTNKQDAALVGLPVARSCTLQSIAQFLYQTLLTLDPNCLAGVESKEWKLFLYSQKFFVATFWSGFDDLSSRKCPEGAFILFQPKSSFERNGLRGGPNEPKLRLNIRRMFASVNKPYDHETLSEAQRFLPEIVWWK